MNASLVCEHLLVMHEMFPPALSLSVCVSLSLSLCVCVSVCVGDNGPPEDQCDWGGSKGPFVGSTAKTSAGGGGSAGKLTSWEGGHREVGVVVWPGHIPAGAVSHVCEYSFISHKAKG